MKKFVLFLALLVSFHLKGQNLQLAASLSYGSAALANIGGYVDTAGNEYALVGTDFGLSIVDVTIPSSPLIKFTVPGPSSQWREVKTYRKYAYVTTEGGGGLTVVDLSHLPTSINYKQYTGDGAIAGQLSSIHALHCDTATGFLYLYGSNIGNGNSLFIDLADPWNPAYAGEYVYPGGGNTSYVHDGYVANDTMYEAHIYSGFFAVVDVRNKSNPVLLATQITPTAFTHNTWLSDDHRTLFTTDENSNSYLAAYDISDLSNITELSLFQTAAGSGSIVHNTHILNDYAITSWYKEGVVITDVSHPGNPVEVGHYDTYPQGSGNGFNGCWGVYPYLPSGTIVASDIDNGLFVLTPTYVRGCYLEGTITDSLTGIAIPGTTINIVSTTISRTSNTIGFYQTGIASAGTYDIQVSKPGYITKTVTGIVLTNGVVVTQDVQLAPIPSYELSGVVTDSLTGLPLPGAIVHLQNSDFDLSATANSQGEYIFFNIIPGTYNIAAGKWGFITLCTSLVVTGGTTQSFALMQGYYDDFSFDFGWTVTGTTPNAWERGEPVGTFDPQNNPVNPEYDLGSDCFDQCFVTDNGGGTYSAHDVDNGYTLLTSPVFDATIYSNPEIEYYRWFANLGGSGSPNDTMKIMLSDGTTTVSLENVTRLNGTASWTQRTFSMAAYLAPTSTMQLMVRIEDSSPGHVLEGALDGFRINGNLTTSIALMNTDPGMEWSTFPNPSSASFHLRLSKKEELQGLNFELRNLLGQVVESIPVEQGTLEFTLGKSVPAGVYTIALCASGKTLSVQKVVKQ